MKNILFILLLSFGFSQVTLESVMDEDVVDDARTEITLTSVSGVVDDLIIVVIGKDDDVAITDHADWTQLVNVTSGTGNAIYVAWRLWDTGDTGWTFTSTDGAEDWVGWLLEFSGHDTTTPIHAYDDSVNTSDAPAAPDVAYTDLEVGSRYIMGFTADDNDTPYSVTGLTEIFNNNNTDTGGAGGYSGIITGTGNVANFAMSQVASEEWASFTVIIEGDGTYVAPEGSDDDALFFGIEF